MSDRCPHCGGSGYLHWSPEFVRRRWCDCPMGKDAARSDLRAERSKPEHQPRRPVTILQTLIHIDERGF